MYYLPIAVALFVVAVVVIVIMMVAAVNGCFVGSLLELSVNF